MSQTIDIGDDMRAVGVTEFGGPEALEVLDLDEPEPGRGQVRISVAAAAVNPTDAGVREGRYGDALEEHGPPWIPGMDLAGTIDVVGAEVDRFDVGDEVMAAVTPMRPEGGAYASSVVVDAASAVHVPDNLSLAQASTLPMNGLTAWLALDTLDLDIGDRLLVTGGAGQLASYVIQLAKQDAIRVYADAAPEDRELVDGFGADLVLDRGEGLADQVREVAPDGVDAVVDTALLHDAILPAVKDGGAVAAVRRFEGETERDVQVHQIMVFDVLDRTDQLQRLASLAADGHLRPRVAETMPASHATEAHERFAEGGVRGRFVLEF